MIVIRPGTDSALELPRIWMRAELEAFGVTPAVLDAPHASGPLEDDTFTCPMVGSPAGDERMGNG